MYEPPPQTAEWAWNWKNWLSGFWRYTEEKGTWTPVYGSETTAADSITEDQQQGFYVRRGAILHAWWYLGTDAVTIGSGTGNLTVEGLPFPCASIPIAEGTIFAQSFNAVTPARAFIAEDDSYIKLDQSDGTNITVADLATGTNSNRMRGYIAYPVEV